MTTQPIRRYVQRKDPKPPARCTAIRYTGEPDNVAAIQAHMAARQKEISSYALPPKVEQLHGAKVYLIVDAPNGRKAVAVPGEWLVWEGEKGTTPWVYEDHQFEDFYQEEAQS